MKISIITNIYRYAEEIDAFFERFYTQNNQNFELVVTVETNTSGQLEKIQKWAEKFENKMKIIYNTKRQGRSKSQRDAIKVATGEYALFICTSDEIKRTDGIDEIIKALDKTNKPDILEFAASFRGVKRWNTNLSIKALTATEIEKRPAFIAKTLPTLANKVVRTDLMLAATSRCNQNEINSKFAIEWMYMFLIYEAKTFATVNKRIVKTFFRRNSVSFNPIRISNQLLRIISQFENNDNKYIQELTYASLYSNAIFLPIFTLAYKNKVMFDKLYDQLTKIFDKDLKNALSVNKYLLKNNREAIWLSARRTKTEIKKTVKDFE
ncbi:glycosyltransferase [Mycoplasma marinum]|uniref:Glycosyltransferase 2-like domain-containing protein n=1 Tax=Mycoplasma marinum TaxID=1937190 RepID=A0A4R0XLG9_9MOLU|nr:glycosyltransferase [Mycoplasma marinum]TCG11526.1 hypothetical protein C4B24_01615 [Mycoplasma marinum]